MKQPAQRSLLKWASLLCNRPITSLTDIQNTDILILLLNKIQCLAFQQLYHLDERASNSASTILKMIQSYYKKQLNCNISQLVDGLNIFKNPMLLWELLIGVAIKGKNRDANINVILQMELQEQSELMLLVEDVIEKLMQYDLGQNLQNRSVLSDSSESNSIRGRKQTQFSNNKRDEFLNELIEQNELLKQKNMDLHNQLSQLKIMQQQLKKTYEQRLNHFKTERYQFLQVLTAGSSTIQSNMRARNKSIYNLRQSVQSGSESKIFDDPLHDLNISITGSLSDIAADMLNAVKNLKKETSLYIQKASILEDHNKDLKISLNQLASENKLLKEQSLKSVKAEKELEVLRKENEDLLKNQTEMLKMMTQVQQQKQYLRDMIEKLKEEKNQLISNGKMRESSMLVTENNQKNYPKDTKKVQKNIDPHSGNSPTQKIDLMKAPSFILRQMSSSELQPESYNLNQEIDDIKNPALKDKYEKQLEELKQKNNQLKQQNNELKHMNKMLQKTVHKSMEKSQEIQRNIEESYKALFGITSSVYQPGEEKQETKTKQQRSNQNKKITQSVVSIDIQNNAKNQSIQEGGNKPEETQKQNQKDAKIIEFYEQVKKIVESYEQKELLMLIEIESLKKQLNDLMLDKSQNFKKQQNKSMIMENRMSQQDLPQYNFKKQQSDMEKSKQDSAMLNINAQGKKGQKQEQQENQVNRIEPKSPVRSDIKSKRNKQLYPSEEFIEIQEGEQLTDNDFPRVHFAKKSELNSIRGSIDQRLGENLAKSITINNQDNQNLLNEGGLLSAEIENNKFDFNRMSTISGIGLRFSKDQRRSFFAKSGFYNQSFIELSNKLQSQIQEDVNEITQVINEKSRRKSSHITEQLNSSNEKEQQLTKQQQQNQQLILKLQRIKQSYTKIKQFHLTSTEQIQSQLKAQLQIDETQIVKLKVMNESLKRSLTEMTSQKQLLLGKIKELKNLAHKMDSSKQVEEIMAKFSQVFKDISELQHIMPELEKCLQESKVKQLQLLYAKEKYQKEKLQEEINILMETIVWFRNLAIEQSDEQ